MSNTLLPCPFCGGEAAVRDIKEPSANGWVGCQRCRCFMDFVNNGKPQAIAAWNSRAEDKPKARADEAIKILQTIDWVGSGAKERIEQTIEILCGGTSPKEKQKG